MAKKITASGLKIGVDWKVCLSSLGKKLVTGKPGVTSVKYIVEKVYTYIANSNV